MSSLRPESRIKSLEKRATDIEAAIEELSADQAESNKAIFKHVQDGFQEAHDYIKQEVETRLDRIETALVEHGDLLRQILDRLPPKQ
jgi:chromosome segregation ATPase